MMKSKTFFALTKALTTCMVEAGSTLLSSSPTESNSFPLSLLAFSAFEQAMYFGPNGHPIHCSFHQILSIRLTWHPQDETATLRTREGREVLRVRSGRRRSGRKCLRV